VVRSPTLPANGPDPLPAWGRSGGATCPGGGSPQPKQLGAPDLPGSTGPPPGPGSPYTIRHPAWAGPEPPRVRRCGHARGAAWLPLEDSPTYRIQCGRRKCALPQQSPRRLLPGCTVGRVLPRRTVQSLAPPTPRMSVYYASWARRLGFAHYDAYMVALTDYAACYIAPTGASLMGQIKTPFGQDSLQGDETYPRRNSQPL